MWPLFLSDLICVVAVFAGGLLPDATNLFLMLLSAHSNNALRVA
jgi:hypothetical protein